MFKGSRNFNPAAGTPVARMLERVGAAFNATTWFDRTNYYETLPPEHLELALELEADRMRGALLRGEDLASEMTVVRNELERGENDPFDLLLALLRHRLPRAPLPPPDDRLARRHRDRDDRAPAGVLRHVLLPGQRHPGAGRRLRARRGAGARGPALRRLPPAPAPIPPAVTREPPQEGERRFVVRRAAEVGWVGCSWRTPEAAHPDTHALAVATDVLTGGVTSRLYQRLVETGKCLDVQAVCLAAAGPRPVPGVRQPQPAHHPRRGRDGHPRGAGRSGATASPTTSWSGPGCRWRRRPPSTATPRPRSPRRSARPSPSGDWRFYFDYLERIRAVSPDDVQRVASNYFSDDTLSVGHFVPRNGVPGATPVRAQPGPLSVRPRPCHWRSEPGQRGARPAPACRRAAAAAAAAPQLHGPPAGLAAGRPRDGRRSREWSAASVLPDMLERGTAALRRIELARAFEDRGVELDISGESFNPLEVFIGGRCLSRHLDLVFDLLFEMLREPTFPEDELARVRQLRLGELAQAQEDTFLRAFEVFTRLLFPAGHPYYRRRLEERRTGLEELDRPRCRTRTRASTGRLRWCWRWLGTSTPTGSATRILGLAGLGGRHAAAPAVERRSWRTWRPARPSRRWPTSPTSTCCWAVRGAAAPGRRLHRRRCSATPCSGSRPSRRGWGGGCGTRRG